MQELKAFFSVFFLSFSVGNMYCYNTHILTLTSDPHYEWNQFSVMVFITTLWIAAPSLAVKRYSTVVQRPVVEAYCQQKALSQWWQNLYIELEGWVTVNKVYDKFSITLYLCFIHRKGMTFYKALHHLVLSVQIKLSLELGRVLVALFFSVWNFLFSTIWFRI